MPSETIKTPCVGICKLDEETLLCLGCKRTRREIEAWVWLTDERRDQIMENLKERQVKHGKD